MEPDRRDDLVSVSAIVVGALVTVVVTVMSLVMTSEDLAPVPLVPSPSTAHEAVVPPSPRAVPPAPMAPTALAAEAPPHPSRDAVSRPD